MLRYTSQILPDAWSPLNNAGDADEVYRPAHVLTPASGYRDAAFRGPTIGRQQAVN